MSRVVGRKEVAVMWIPPDTYSALGEFCYVRKAGAHRRAGCSRSPEGHDGPGARLPARHHLAPPGGGAGLGLGLGLELGLGLGLGLGIELGLGLGLGLEAGLGMGLHL